MIIHICIDSIFNGYIIDHFEKVNKGKNRYIIISEDKELFFKREKEIEIFNKNEVLLLLKREKYFIIHSLLKKEPIWFASQFYAQHKVAWFSWGGDIPVSNVEINYEPLSLIEFKKDQKKITIKDRLYGLLALLPFVNKWYYFFRVGEHHPKYQKEKALSNIDLFSTVLPAEKKDVESLVYFRAKYMWFNYGTLNYIMGDFFGANVPLKKGVFVGHSGYFESNHLDSFEIINQMKLGMEIYCPLAYGNNHCIQIIMERGLELFGEKINFQREVLDQSAYVKLLTSNHILIMNTIQQQGVGNLLICIYLGMKVFLNPKGYLFEFCTSLGLKVYNLKEDFTEIEIEHFLERNYVIHNREILEKVYSEDDVEKRTKLIIEELKTLK